MEIYCVALRAKEKCWTRKKNCFSFAKSNRGPFLVGIRPLRSNLDCRFGGENYHKKINHRVIYVLFTSAVICGSYRFRWLAFAGFCLFGAHCKQHSLCSVLISQMCIIHRASMRRRRKRRSEQRDVPEIIASTRISSHE